MDFCCVSGSFCFTTFERACKGSTTLGAGKTVPNLVARSADAHDAFRRSLLHCRCRHWRLQGNNSTLMNAISAIQTYHALLMQYSVLALPESILMTLALRVDQIIVRGFV